jgi:hypothetical protein
LVLPVNGDFVMTEIVESNGREIIKLIYDEKSTISLQTHSSNPVHKPFVFEKISKGFYTRGVVFAIPKSI